MRAKPEAKPSRIPVGPIHGPEEREADRLAAQMNQPATRGLAGCTGCAVSAPAPCPACAAGARSLLRSATGPAHTDPGRPLGRLLSRPGAPLPRTQRARFEQRLGTDLSPLRLHLGEEAAVAARAVNARAFAYGNDIVFGADAPTPDTAAGEHLLAHEVAHTLGPGSQALRRFAPEDMLRATIAPDAARGMSDADLRLAHGLVVSVVASAPGGGAEQRSAMENRNTLEAEGAARGLALGGNAMLGQRVEGQDASAPVIFEAEELETTPLLVPDPVAGMVELPDPGPPPIPALVLPPGYGGQGGSDASGVPGLSGLGTSAGLSSHIFAMGEHAATQNGRMMTMFGPQTGPGAFGPTLEGMSSRQYWQSFVPSRGTIQLDRVVDQVPRDLDPYFSNVRQGRPSPGLGRDIRTVANVTDQDLMQIPRLIERYNNGTISAAERDMLVRLARIHANGTPQSSPFASYMQPGAPTPGVGERLFRVRIEVPRGMALDHRFENAEEAEFLLSMDHRGRLVQSSAGMGPMEGASRTTQFLVRHGGKIRWAGRIVLVAAVAHGAYRVTTAAPGERGRVAGEELGGLALGALGTIGAAAGCVALGIATAGAGLLVCGLVGGAAAGAIGSYVGGEVGERMQHDPLGPATWVVNHAVTAYTDSMIQSADPTVRADGVAIRRVIYQDDSFSMMYLMNRMCGGCLSYPGSPF